MSNKLPSKKVRQLGPDVWTFNGYDEQVDIGTEWITVAQGPINNCLELITAIAGDKMEAFDYDPPIPYPDEPYQLDSVEQTAWADLKSKPDYIENVSCVKLYQLVGRYYKYDEVEYQKGVDDNTHTPIPELGLIKTSSKTLISTQAEFDKAVKKD